LLADAGIIALMGLLVRFRLAARSGSYLVAAGLCVALAGCAGQPAVRGVIVLDIDTLRADALGCYGNALGTSPAIDAFAARAARFDWTFSQAPYTLPSQASILTSLYPWAHDVLRNSDRLGDSALTLAEVFAGAGWKTGAFVDGGFFKEQFGFSQGFATYTDVSGGGLAAMRDGISSWLRENGSRNFFLFIHTYDVHSPYDPPEPFRTRFATDAPKASPGFVPTTEVLNAIRESQWKPPLRKLPPNDLAFARAMYLGEVAAVDRWFEHFLEELRALQLDRGTVIAIVSDHGEEFQEHGSLLHDKLYATVTHVPMVVSVPGSQRGSVIRTQVETIDLFPTLLELAGIAAPPGLQGRSLASSVRSGSEPEPRLAFGMSPFYGEQRFAADADHQLVLTLRPTRLELFAYRSDPSEQDDLAARDSALATRLSRAIRARRNQTLLDSSLRDELKLDEATATQLRALGYLN